MSILKIGIDDTDSLEGMCTTYIGALLHDGLAEYGRMVESRLVRLNPNIKYKTRGNAAVALTMETNHKEKAKELVLDTVEELSMLQEKNTNPGVVFVEGEAPWDLQRIYHEALHSVVQIDSVEKILKDSGMEYYKFKNGRGIIGASAAIGADLSPSTYEIIAYRPKERWGTERNIDKESVFRMDKATLPLSYNNVDLLQDRVLIAPHTPCPVLFGIRGIDESILKRAFGMVISEPVERKILYKTNQGTDAHLEEVGSLAEVRPYSSVAVKGKVSRSPFTITGGHVIFEIMDTTGRMDCAAYEPTGPFREIVKKLEKGDEIKAYGGVRESAAGTFTINLEKFEVLNLAPRIELENPPCPVCGKNMKSKGIGQGFKCIRCGIKAPDKIEKISDSGLEKKTYQVPPGAMRHLSRPQGLELSYR